MLFQSRQEAGGAQTREEKKKKKWLESEGSLGVGRADTFPKKPAEEEGGFT